MFYRGIDNIYQNKVFHALDGRRSEFSILPPEMIIKVSIIRYLYTIELTIKDDIQDSIRRIRIRIKSLAQKIDVIT